MKSLDRYLNEWKTKIKEMLYEMSNFRKAGTLITNGSLNIIHLVLYTEQKFSIFLTRQQQSRTN